jgi:arginase family enzyme
MIHFDAHSDTNDSYFGGERFTHGTPFRRAVEEGSRPETHGANRYSRRAVLRG